MTPKRTEKCNEAEVLERMFEHLIIPEKIKKLTQQEQIHPINIERLE